MTSPSRRNRPTTRRSTRGTVPEAALALFVVLLSSVTEAQAGSPPDPLERLRQRSASQRWERIRNVWRTESEPRTPAGRESNASPEPDVPAAPAAENDAAGPPKILPLPGLSTPATDSFSRNAGDTARVTSSSDDPPAGQDSPPPGPENSVNGSDETDAVDDAVEARRRERMIEEGYKVPAISTVRPFADFEPEPEYARNDPCRHLCPRPGEEDCRPRDEDGNPLPPIGVRARACPQEYELPRNAGDLRPEHDSIFAWKASNLYHNPLYFDDPALERYGHTHYCAVQPFVSCGRFGAQLVTLPYKATIDPYWKKMYTLGWYQPQEWSPQQVKQPPLNVDAAAAQAAWTTGFIFLVP